MVTYNTINDISESKLEEGDFYSTFYSKGRGEEANKVRGRRKFPILIVIKKDVVDIIRGGLRSLTAGRLADEDGVSEQLQFMLHIISDTATGEQKGVAVYKLRKEKLK